MPRIEPSEAEKDYIRELFRGRCMLCRQQGTDVHEIIPRSHGLRSLTSKNMILLCRGCHSWVHGISPDKIILQSKRKKYLEVVGER